ncbi:MAG: cation transporter [Rhodospirillales bacterium]
MKPYLAAAALAVTVLAADATLAGEASVTLAVDGMTCVACPYIVKQALAGVSGVRTVAVSFPDKKAVVTYDAGKTSFAVLTAATNNVGFPSRVME